MSAEVLPPHAVEMSPEDSSRYADSEVFETPSQIAGLSDTGCIEQTPTDPTQHLPKIETPEPRVVLIPEISERAKNRPTTYIHHRAMFTDGWNSLWHFVFGLLALKYPIIVSVFIVYQFLNIYEANVFVDVFEFLIGHVVGCLYVLI
jgi:hypothetical protein